MNTLIKYWSYLVENEDKEISFETYILSEDKKTYIQKHQSEEDFDKEILDKYWNEIRSRIKGKPEADIDQFWMSKPFKELANFVNNFDTRNQKERKTDKNKEAAIKAGAHYLGDMQAKNGLTYEIWIPTSHKSANILRNIYKGGNDIGTAWCITVASDNGYWYDYIEEGNNFVFLLNKDPIISKTDYRFDDKIAAQIELNDTIILWDMNDNDDTLNINNFKSIIDFAIKKGKEEKLFPNKYEEITIGGEKARMAGPNINCSDKNLTSLKGSPKEIAGSFYCNSNKLTSLKDAPQEVGERFDCSDNQLTSLKGAPQKVGGSFDCKKNRLTSLEGCPQEVGEHFYCRNNKLVSLKGCPKEVKGDFNCSDNQLTSLVCAPEVVVSDFDCSGNKLTSLKGAPKRVGWEFSCNNNNLISLEGAPQIVNGSFNCENNPDLPQYKIDAYRAYLKLPYSERDLLTKDNHYYPTEEWENKFK